MSLPSMRLGALLLAAVLLSAGCQKYLEPPTDGGIEDTGPQPDTGEPDAPLLCGNGGIDGSEDCDGTDLAGQTCQDQGFDSGDLACGSNCTFDTSQCVRVNCGNGQLDTNEPCDDTEFGGKTCKSEGFAGGTLGCTDNCSLNTTQCTNCGNGKVDSGEECDGTDLGGKQCSDLSFTGGTLKCNTATCAYDTSGCTGSAGKTLSNVVFLHHSVGEGIVGDGDLRTLLTAFNTANGTQIKLWDQVLYSTDINDPTGNTQSSGYTVPRGTHDTTTPPDWENLWTNAGSQYATPRNQILADHEVIVFKNCFYAIDQTQTADFQLASATDLATWKTRYLNMRNFFDTRKDKLFIVFTVPPTTKNNTTPAYAQLARDFSKWLCSPTYLTGHDNVACFDIFDRLAIPEGQADANTIGANYWTDDWDPHPNSTANQMLATDLTGFLGNLLKTYKTP